MRNGFLLLSFGGPEGPDDVMPFLRNVASGRGIPEERLAAVAEHYQRFGGVSPINEQNRTLLAAIAKDFAADGMDLPVYWGNRNWHPMLPDTLAQMRDDGIGRAYAFVTSAYGSYSACRQYLEDITAARAKVGPGAPVIEKLRHFHDDPGFIGPHTDGVQAALAAVPGHDTRLVFTAHSIPLSMAESAGPEGGLYEAQLLETASLVAAGAGVDAWDLVWQSRSGPPQVPWLAPDINDHLATLAGAGASGVVVSPIGFVSDHLEVVWDLDVEAAATAERLGLGYARAATPGTDPRFVKMITRLVQERMTPSAERWRTALGRLDHWDTCPAACCGRPAQ